MSARQWKQRLEEAQGKLTGATTAAVEWKKVAENRLEIIRQLDEAIKFQLEALQTVGEIFGVKVSLDQAVWSQTTHMDAGGVAMYIMGKVEATSIYLRDLMKEASEIQLTLSDTYALASEAIAVSRPTEDLTIPSDLSRVRDPASPLSDLGEGLNDIPGPSPDTVQSNRNMPVEFPKRPSAEGPSSALSLFSA